MTHNTPRTEPAVVISETFLDSLVVLPRVIQQKTRKFMKKFRANPQSPGLKYEKIDKASDAKLHSLRVDLEYRVIVATAPQSGAYVLLWVDHHDEAYAWARRRRIDMNAVTGTVQVYAVEEQETPYAGLAGTVGGEGNRRAMHPEAADRPAMLEELSDTDILYLGVPEAMLPAARGLTGLDDLEAKRADFPRDAYENLSWIANGFPFDEVRALVEDQRGEVREAADFTQALLAPGSAAAFAVATDDESLSRILDASLEKWRVFLHPSQRRLVERTYSGSARILGGAGTGKTVVAMHRARHLAENSDQDTRILFTTYSSTLAADIRQNLATICSRRALAKIEVVNLDKWVTDFLKTQGFAYKVEYRNEQIDQAWQRAIDDSHLNLDFTPQFYRDEWQQIIIGQPSLTREEYLRARRTGRGVRLGRKDRLDVWKVVEEYKRIQSLRNTRDIDYAMHDVAALLTRGTLAKYDHVIVDEGQDFSAVAYRLLRALAGEEHTDDIFIVGDAHQRIYRRRAVLSRCGINVRGRRASILRINYRTTEEIRAAATRILEGVAFDDLDGGTDSDSRVQSLMHGQAPQLSVNASTDEERDTVLAHLRLLETQGVEQRNICVAGRTRYDLDTAQEWLRTGGYRAVRLRSKKADNRSLDGVRLATMHRLKGLEFEHIVLIRAEEARMPPAAAMRRAHEEGNVETVLNEERSLLYVALTRAKKSTLITCAGKPTALLSLSSSAP